MAKKRATKSSSDKQKSNHAPEMWGLMFIAIAITILLSSLSFAFTQKSHNWLGLVGYGTGWVFHASFGLGCYFISLYLGWIGWRLLFQKSLNYLPLKTLYFAVFIFSLCMLLSVIEDEYPYFNDLLNRSFYPFLWQRKLRYHLGGAPFYFLYRDLPSLNFSHVFNIAGTMLIFGSTLLASILFLAKISPKKIIEGLIKFKALFNKPQTPQKTSEEKEEKAEAPASQVPFAESDLLRFVKLRTSATPQSTSPDGSSGNSQEFLAIQPEKNPLIRPSLSRKELSDPDPQPLEEEPVKNIAKKEIETQRPAPETEVKPTLASEAKTAPKGPRKREAALAAQRVYNGDFSAYQLPSLTLLTNPKKFDQSSLKRDLKRQAEVLEETLLSFGIEAKVGQINCGPTITSFEVHPAIGVKVQKIKALEDDIALNMEAKSIRIIAPIPGKAAVGIEVPNPQPQEVAFKDMLSAYQQSGRKLHIPILLGKAVNGDYVMNDLAKMPHCIIAGATGSGKSVCINTIVMSILLNARPDEIKLIMVDPKKVELTPYTNLPHMLAPVITEPQGACAALQWLVKEMENRYEILKQVGVRNIEAFNTRTIDKALEESLDREIPAKMHYIVGIIDELADLMMVASSDIETPIARIAQMARAVGIHLILATQRPSREVITGLIKANFPTRISFKVASRVNSQIVLDETGAESLLGNGDMLFLPPGTSHLIRAQGAFIRDEDINAVVKVICDQAPPNYVIQSFDKIGYLGGDAGEEDSAEEEEKDSLYDQAVDTVLSTGNASTTFLQRKLKIGYARAASIIDQMEMKGIVGPAEGAKPRKILVAKQGATESGKSFEDE